MMIALYSGGCEQDQQQRQAMGKFFPPPGEVRDIQRISRVQCASGAAPIRRFRRITSTKAS